MFPLYVQAWYHVGRRAYTLPELDRLFGLSNPLSLFRIIASRHVLFLLPLVVIEIVIKSLALLPLFIPGALYRRKQYRYICSRPGPLFGFVFHISS